MKIMINWRFLGVACGVTGCLLGWSAAASAQGAQPLAVDDLLRIVVRNNPSIRAAWAELDAAAARSRVETAYPDPTLSAIWWPEKSSEGKQGTLELMLEQGVPLPGKLGAVGKVRDAEEAAARIALQRAVRDVTLKVRESAVELVYLRSAARIADGNRELLARLRAAGETGYAAGRAGLYDALRAQAQEAQTLFDRRLFVEIEATEAARLNSLLSRPTDTPIGELEIHAGRPLLPGAAEIADAAASSRQEVLLARAEGERARAERRVAGFEALPELMLGVGYMQESALADMEESSRWNLRLSLSLPVVFRKNAGRRTEARAGEERARWMEREAGDLARAEVAENWFRLKNAERLAALYRDTLLPQAVASIQLAETWYRSGQGSFADLVDAGTLWYSFQLALARAGADREKFLARLEALAERPLAPATVEGGAVAAVPADEPAWRETLARIESDRAALAGAVASPLAGLERMLPDARRAGELANAAEDGAAAAAALAGEFSLADVEALVLLRSPEVRAAQRSARAALEQFGQVAALDEVVRAYAGATGSLMTGAGGAMGDTAAATYPFPGMLALKGQVVAQDAEAARADLERVARDALAAARRLYWAVVFSHRAAALTGELRDLAARAVPSVRARYESGQGLLSDLTRAHVELEKLRTEEETVVAGRVVPESQLRALLALPRDAPLGTPRGTETPPAVGGASRLAELAVERRQELRKMRAMATRMELMIQMAERETVPGFAFAASAFENQPLLQDGTMAMREPFVATAAAATGTGTPLRAFAGRVSGYVRETRERLAALREEIRAEEAAAVARVDEAWFAFDRASREERLWVGRVAELSRLAGESQDRAYRAGLATQVEALEAARGVVESALEAARRRWQLGEAWANLEAAAGGPLPVAAEEE